MPECTQLQGKEIDPKCVQSQQPIGISLCGETYKITVNNLPYIVRILPFSQQAASEAQLIVERLANSQRIAAYLDWFKFKGQMGILMEYVEGTLLSAVIAQSAQAGQTLHQSDLSQLLRSGLEALQELVQHGLAHGDIKPENLMIRNGKLVLLDVALPCYSRSANSCVHSCVATPRYMAPEALAAQIDGLPLTLEQQQRADVWSLAIALAELATLKTPYPQIGRAAIYAAQVRAPLVQDQSPLGLILQQMLTLDPDRRPSAQQLLSSMPISLA